MARTSFLPGFGVVAETSTTRASFLPGFGVVVETSGAVLAFDAVSNATPGTGNLSWTHTPVGTPRGVLVGIFYPTDAVDAVTGVTYGGVAMTEVAGSPLIKATSEDSVVIVYHLGSGIPTGAQTVSVTISGSTVEKAAVAYTVTAGTDTVVQDTGTISNDSIADPSVTLDHGGNDCFDAIFLKSGVSAPTFITPFVGWTSSYEFDFGLGAAGVGGAYKFDPIGSENVSAGWTQGADDATAIAVAIREVKFPTVSSITATQFSTATTSFACDLPASVEAGDLLLLFVTSHSASSHTGPAGWTQLAEHFLGSILRGTVWKRNADGTEGGGTATVTIGSSEQGSAQVWRIPASSWHGDIANVEISANNAGDGSNNLNPLSLSPVWGAEDTLWIAAAMAGDDDQSVTVWPTDYIDNQTETLAGAGVNNSAAIYATSRELNAASEDPGAFTIQSSESWLAWTIAIRPVAGAGGANPKGPVGHPFHGPFGGPI